MEKINIAELLKDCPKGIELDCTICNGVKFIELDRNPNFPIVVRANNGYEFSLTKYGQVHNIDESKCVIFPKGKTTWEGFIPPYQFKDGDILTYMFCNKPTIYIYRKDGDYNTSYYAAYSSENDHFYYIQTGALAGNRNDLRFATEEEKQKLFDAIEENGYKWNAKTKTLEKLPKFNVGDKIRNVIVNLGAYTVLKVETSGYTVKKEDKYGNNFRINFGDEKNWELAPNKFDITTLKPFDKVLIRCSLLEKWRIQFFEKYNEFCKFPFICMGCSKYNQCIPYEGNEHLLGTINDCNDYYKTWK